MDISAIIQQYHLELHVLYIQSTQRDTFNDIYMSIRGAPLFPLSQASNSLQDQER